MLMFDLLDDRQDWFALFDLLKDRLEQFDHGQLFYKINESNSILVIFKGQWEWFFQGRSFYIKEQKDRKKDTKFEKVGKKQNSKKIERNKIRKKLERNKNWML